MFDKAGNGSPTVIGTIRVVPQQRYTLFVEVLRTDYDNADEYADVTINVVNIGKCEGCSAWQDCTSTNGRSKHNSILIIHKIQLFSHSFRI